MRPPIGLFRLSLIAIFVGVVTGFGAIAFRGLIGFIHNLLFLGHFSFFYDANAYTPPSPWGAFVILVPVLGALVVTLRFDRSQTVIPAPASIDLPKGGAVGSFITDQP